MKVLRIHTSIGAVLALALAVALTCATAGAAATASKSAKPTKAPINVLYVASQSGPLAPVGNAFLHGAVAAARIINASGGVLGHPVTLKIVDSASDGSKA